MSTYDNMLKPLMPGQSFPWLWHKCDDPNCCLRRFWCSELKRMGFGCRTETEKNSSSYVPSTPKKTKPKAKPKPKTKAKPKSRK